MIETRLDPRQAMATCLTQWRDLLAECDDVGLQEQVRDIESASRMLHSVMLEAVAELDSRNIAATTGFGTTKRLLAGMLHLSATEAGTRVTHATRYPPHPRRRSAAADAAEHRRRAGRRGDRPSASPGDHRNDERNPHLGQPY
ncbi:MAG: hypothetical protein ACRDRW_17180 [Pseudonocardiaceae bacterium]